MDMTGKTVDDFTVQARGIGPKLARGGFRLRRAANVVLMARSQECDG